MMTQQQRAEARKSSSALRTWGKVITLVGIPSFVILFALTATIRISDNQTIFNPASLAYLFGAIPCAVSYKIFQVIANTYDLMDSNTPEIEGEQAGEEDNSMPFGLAMGIVFFVTLITSICILVMK
jgi:hypothetical protein|nr:MAG TPA: hypothetical protein [Caudoviricetes sp.]DAX31616.1 MAG TPA: hypothetical protein [Caudoviricetes sp.]